MPAFADSTIAPAPAETPVPGPTVTMTPIPTPIPIVTSTPTVVPIPTAPPSPSETPSPIPAPESGSSGQQVTLEPRPAVIVEGKATRDEVFSAIQASIATARDEIGKAAIKATGSPIAVFLQADDNGFVYRVEIPIDAAPEGKTQLTPTVKFGQTPVGKAMRFEYRGSYDEIDATYEAITALLDEKGLDAQDVFFEEYVNDIKASDDPNLQVEIYVLLK